MIMPRTIAKIGNIGNIENVGEGGEVRRMGRQGSFKGNGRGKTALAALALALLAGGSGCGQLSFMEVAVVVRNNTGILPECLFTIDLCQVKVSGTESGDFTLGNFACTHPTNYQIAKFQYGTDESSGNIAFHVDIFDGNLKKLGQGDGSGAIKDGGRQPVTVDVVPDTAAFACNAP